MELALIMNDHAGGKMACEREMGNNKQLTHLTNAHCNLRTQGSRNQGGLYFKPCNVILKRDTC